MLHLSSEIATLEILSPLDRLQRVRSYTSLSSSRDEVIGVDDLHELLGMFSGTDKIDALECLLFLANINSLEDVKKVASAFTIGLRAYASKIMMQKLSGKKQKGDPFMPLRFYHTKARSEENLALIVQLHDDSSTTSNQRQVLDATVREESLGITSDQLCELLAEGKSYAVDLIGATFDFILEHTVEEVVRAANLFDTFDERLIVLAALIAKVYDPENLAAFDPCALNGVSNDDGVAIKLVREAIAKAIRSLPAYPYSPLFGGIASKLHGSDRSTPRIIYYSIDNTASSESQVVTSQGERITILRLCVKRAMSGS